MGVAGNNWGNVNCCCPILCCDSTLAAVQLCAVHAGHVSRLFERRALLLCCQCKAPKDTVSCPPAPERAVCIRLPVPAGAVCSADRVHHLHVPTLLCCNGPCAFQTQFAALSAACFPFVFSSGLRFLVEDQACSIQYGTTYICTSVLQVASHVKCLVLFRVAKSRQMPVLV
jgi:hypothetical protein